MTELIEFMRDTATKMRELTAIAPEIAETLRLMAAELEQRAAEMEGRTGIGDSFD